MLSKSAIQRDEIKEAANLESAWNVIVNINGRGNKLQNTYASECLSLPLSAVIEPSIAV